MIKWAVIPVAGHGRRMQPAAAVVPKALLPVGTWPMLHWTLDEAIAASIPGIILVVGPEQQLIREYLKGALEAARCSHDTDLARLGRGLRDREVRWIEQPEPVGVGDALVRCRPLTGPDVFAVLLPDNWFHAPTPAIEQVAVAYSRTGLCSIGLTEVTAKERSLFGNVGGVSLRRLDGDCYRVLTLQDKLPGTFAGEGAESVLRGCARYIVDERFYEALLATGPPPQGEWDDVAAFQQLIDNAGLAAQRIDGRHYDVGHRRGYLAAATYLGRCTTDDER